VGRDLRDADGPHEGRRCCGGGCVTRLRF
jgi:hypothetical protein